ncbi:MAG: hypothetical protein J7M21_05385 [Planctomycetes bacterium]|nr:hypothetical protein [Planctomycetota bacterium]
MDRPGRCRCGTAEPLRPRVAVLAVLLLTCGRCPAAAPGRYFAIQVVDEQTGRGVPLVELRTVNGIRRYTDSAGMVAFHEPGLMNRDVFFWVRSPGYEFPADGFGFHGRRLRTTPGEAARLKLRRKNIAERLYRITGQGIYRDTVLLGRAAPIKEPLLNAHVVGQDSVQAVVYRGRIYWFWGDTNSERYPLGHFAAAGATSELPGSGGLDPAVGIDLRYFVDAGGFSRDVAPMPGNAPVWLDALMTLKDHAGRRRLVAHYSRMKGLARRIEHGMVVFNDETQTFERAGQFDPNCRLEPAGQALRVGVGGEQYYYFTPSAYPFVRVKARWDDVMNPARYEAFTCLAPGSGWDAASPKLDRDADGRLVWSWKRDTAAIDALRQQALIRAGKIKPAEAWIRLRDVETGRPVHAHRGSVRWNAFRGRWIMIFVQVGGTSYLGEIWYSEADSPEGPWTAARKIATHEGYSFYNPVHHAFFDQRGGRIIYFEGTYSRTFSRTRMPTPRYDYNQVMYRLDLADPRLRASAPSNARRRGPL